MTKYVVNKAYYGLGGLLAVLACSVYYCRQSGRKLIIDWRGGHYGTPEINPYPTLFDYPASESVDVLEQINSSDVYPEHWGDYISLPAPLAKGVPLTLATLDNVEAETEVSQRKKIIVLSRDSSHFYNQSLRRCFSDIFQSIKPRKELLEQIEEFQGTIFQRRPVIGVHYRHGNGEKSIIPADIHWYFNAIDDLIEKCGSEYLIFLCTDCSRVLDRFVERYGSRVCSTHKAYNPPGSGAMHYWTDLASKLRSAEEAIKDIWLLSKCDRMVISKSFFAYAAARINGSLENETMKMYVPKNRSFKQPQDWVSASSVTGVSKVFKEARMAMDSVYVKENEGISRLFYLYEPVGVLNSAFSPIGESWSVILDRIKDIRSY